MGSNIHNQETEDLADYNPTLIQPLAECHPSLGRRVEMICIQIYLAWVKIHLCSQEVDNLLLETEDSEVWVADLLDQTHSCEQKISQT